MLKTCPQCNKEFKTYRTAAIYCGKDCHNASMVMAKTYTCTGCGEDFKRPNYRVKKSAKRHFCTPECLRNWRKATARSVACKVCGKTFRHPNATVYHCSWECRNKGLVTAVQLVCQNCGEGFRAFAGEAKDGRKFCSHGCSEEYHTGYNHPHYKEGAWLERGARWGRIRKQIIERDGKCLWCGATSNPSGRGLHVHHIKPRREHLIVDFANDHKNLVTLCAPCHMKVEMRLHHGRIADVPKWLRVPA